MIAALATCPLFRTPCTPPLAAVARRRCTARVIDEAAPAGPGWFDSSWDLRSGLTVVEHRHLHGDTLELAVELLVQ